MKPDEKFFFLFINLLLLALLMILHFRTKDIEDYQMKQRRIVILNDLMEDK